MSVKFIHGPMISCTDLGAQRALFEGVYGLKRVAEQVLSEADVLSLFGVEGRRALTLLMETPGTHFGVRLVQFDPLSDLVIRESFGPSAMPKSISFARHSSPSRTTMMFSGLMSR